MIMLRLDFRIGPSARRGTNTEVIQLLLRTLMPRRAMIKIPNVIGRSVISMAFCTGVSAS